MHPTLVNNALDFKVGAFLFEVQVNSITTLNKASQHTFLPSLSKDCPEVIRTKESDQLMRMHC